MKKIAMVVAMGVIVTGVSWAGPKDKTSQTLVNPDSIAGSADWDNLTVQTKVKSAKCKTVIKAKTKVPGDLVSGPIICLLEADVKASSLGGGVNWYGNSVVVAGEAIDGQVQIKADLRSVGCGIQSDAVSINGGTSCYAEDPVIYDWFTTCINSGMLPVPANSVGGTEGYNPGGLLGICQGTVANGDERIDPPLSLLAVQGQNSPLF